MTKITACRFLNLELREEEIRRIGLRPWKDRIVERTLRLTGGALDALERVFAGENLAGTWQVALIMPSGRRVRAIASSTIWRSGAEKALLQPEVSRVLILDLTCIKGMVLQKSSKTTSECIPFRSTEK